MRQILSVHFFFFTVGADIDEMSKKSFSLLVANEFPNFSAFTKSRKVIVAAVNGYAVCYSL